MQTTCTSWAGLVLSVQQLLQLSHGLNPQTNPQEFSRLIYFAFNA